MLVDSKTQHFELFKKGPIKHVQISAIYNTSLIALLLALPKTENYGKFAIRDILLILNILD